MNSRRLIVVLAAMLVLAMGTVATATTASASSCLGFTINGVAASDVSCQYINGGNTLQQIGEMPAAGTYFGTPRVPVGSLP